MLKGYVPPGSSMNMFVRQYAKLQFDRESDESFEEKRTKLVSLSCLLVFEEKSFEEKRTKSDEPYAF
jgi:hypothetical protein